MRTSYFSVAIVLAFLPMGWGMQLSWSAEPGKPEGVQGQTLQFTPPPSSQPADSFEDEGRPPERTAGGSRDICQEQLVAIVPGSGVLNDVRGSCKTPSRAFLALTKVEYPTLWVYVPMQLKNRTLAKVVLVDAQDQPMHIQYMVISGAPGVVHIPLTGALPVQQTYRWIFSLEHKPQRPTKNPMVEGLIRRVVPDPRLRDQLANAASNRVRIQLLSRYGFWYDALTALAMAKRKSDALGVAGKDWQDFLGSVGLGAIATQPLLNCCLPHHPLQPITNQ